MISRKILFLCALFFSGCASPVELESLGSVNDPGWSSASEGDVPSRFLVVGYAYDADKRAAFETAMVADLRAAGVLAEASMEHFPDLRNLEISALIDYLEASPDAAVLVARALVVTQERYRSGHRVSLSGLLSEDAVIWEVAQGALLQASLYVPGWPKAVWWEHARLSVQRDIGMEALGAYAEAVVRSLVRDGVIARQED
jgi:hypothetical protein